MDASGEQQLIEVDANGEEQLKRINAIARGAAAEADATTPHRELSGTGLIMYANEGGRS